MFIVVAFGLFGGEVAVVGIGAGRGLEYLFVVEVDGGRCLGAS